MINDIVTMSDLAERIKELEIREAQQLASIKLLKDEILEDLKPAALVKKAFNQIVGNKDLQHNALNTSLGIGAGFIARKLFTFNSKNIFRKLTGYALQAITTKLVSKKIPAIRDKIADL